MAQPRTIIIDGERAVRDLLAEFAARCGCEVVGIASDGRNGLELCRRQKPELVIHELYLPAVSGFEVIRRARALAADTRFLVFSRCTDSNTLVALLALEPNGIVDKHLALSELGAALQSLIGGGSYFSPRAQRLMHKARNEESSSTAALGDELSDRELDVLRLIAEGFSNKEIADQLHISVKTVENHRTRLMRKLDLHDAVALTRYAISRGIVLLESA